MQLAKTIRTIRQRQNARPAKRGLAISVSLGVLAFAGSAAAQEQPAAAQTARDTAPLAEPGLEQGPPPAAEAADSRDIAAPSPPPPGIILPAVEPIIDDVEFRSAMPKISVEDDAELDRPLESIAEFEARQAEELAAQRQAEAAAPASASASATGVASVGAGSGGVAGSSVVSATQDRPLPAGGNLAPDAVPIIGEAPIRDAELVAPLPPLDSFDVTPVTFAEAETDNSSRQVRYEIVVNGVSEAFDDSDVSLNKMFKDLSALHEGDGKADNVAMLRARMTADGELMQRIMASEGYYDAAVNTRIDRQEADAPLNAVINVVPGPRYSFSQIRIDAAPTIPENLIAANFPLKIGEPIVAQRVQGAEAGIALKLPEEGYPFATVGQRDILLDAATGEGEYSLPVTVGPRARFGDVATTGDLAFDADHVAKLARFRRGDLYDSRMVDDLRQALVTTGLFSNVAAEPQRTEQLAEDGSEYVTMLVTQQAGPPRTLAGSVGYGTGEGVRLQGSWTHRNMFPPEGALIVSGVAGTQEQRLGVSMRRSNAGRRDRTFELVGEALRSDYKAFEALTGRIGFRVSYDSTPLWQKKLSYAYGAQLIATQEDDYDFATGTRVKDFYTILGLTGQLGMDRTDSLLNPTKGFRITTLLQPEGSLAGGFTPYARTQIDGSAYYPVMENLVLAGRIRIASILGAERESLAPSRRFYGGGGGSVRGFGYQQLGPKDPENNPIGGRSLNEVAVEARYRFGNFGVVGFVDAGQVYRSSQPDFSNMRLGVGLGGRFYTNFGPMRLDVATPIGRKAGESRVSVYVSIGQAF